MLAGGIIAGAAALGLMSIDVTPDHPTVVVPGPTSPRPAVIVSPGVPIPAPITAS